MFSWYPEEWPVCQAVGTGGGRARLINSWSHLWVIGGQSGDVGGGCHTRGFCLFGQRDLNCAHNQRETVQMFMRLQTCVCVCSRVLVCVFVGVGGFWYWGGESERPSGEDP